MIAEGFLGIKRKFYEFSVSERLFLAFSMICGFCISAEYAVIRPVSSSLLVTSYSSSILPYAWLFTVPLNFVLVFLYNRYLPKVGISRMFFIISLLVVFGNIFVALFAKQIQIVSFLFYLWKEVYVLLMFQQLWSMIHTTITTDKAKYLYGILFGIGGIGGVLGSLFPGFFAVSIGSESLLFVSLPIYSVLLVSFLLAYKYSKISKGTLFPDKKGLTKKTFFEGFQLISKSKVLAYILCTVFFMQLASALLEFQFTTFLEKNILTKDLRTEYCGKIFGIVNLITTTLQLFGTYLILRFLGLKKSHFIVPILLGCNAVGVLFFPVFGMVSYSYIMSKAMDFSVFGVIREMLYIPLSTDEKFRAKAVIDVFVHRSSKAFASFLVLFFQVFLAAQALSYVAIGTFFIFLAWTFLVLRVSKQEKVFA